jgi:release factor glutamine methyltransferase
VTGARAGLEDAALRTGGALAAAATALAASSDSPRLDAELLLAFAAGRTRAAVLASPERVLAADAATRFAALLDRRVRGEPLAYLTGEREFFSLPLAVSRDVLVPRAETELLVDVALAAVVSVAEPAVLDLGTGSGAIALAIKQTRRAARVTATDCSTAALAVARSNAARLALDVRFVESHWFEKLRGEAFDVIVSNPPYVRSADVTGALSFEPRQALDGGADGLDAYRALLGGAAKHVAAGNGVLLLEHGAEQRPELVALAMRHGWRVVAMHDDLAGRPRVLVLAVGE